MTEKVMVRLKPEQVELLRTRYENQLLQAQQPPPKRGAVCLRNDEGLYCLAGAVMTDEQIDETDLQPAQRFYKALGLSYDGPCVPNVAVYERTYMQHDKYVTRVDKSEFDQNIHRILDTGVLCEIPRDAARILELVE